MPDYSGSEAASSGDVLASALPGDILPAPSDETGFLQAPTLGKNEARVLKERMKRAERYMERSFKDTWERCLKLWRGQHWKEQRLPSPDHRVVVNYIAPTIQTKVDSIAFNPVPDIILKPLTEASQGNSDIATQAVKYEWRRSNAARETKRALFDKELFGFGVVQTGWEFVTDEVALDDGRMQVQGEPPEPKDLSEAIETGEELEPPVPRARVRKDQFYVRRLSPKDFRIDPEATYVIDDASYCGYVELRPLDDVKKDKRYKNTRQLKGSSRNMETFLDEDTLRMPDEIQPSDVKRVRLLHYYERKRRLHCVFVDEHDQPLLVERWKWKQDRYPFRAIHSSCTEDVFYPEQAPAVLLEPMQREINETRSQLHIHRRRYNRKYQCRRGILDAQAKKQLRSGSDGVVVEHTGTGQQEIIPIADAPLQEEVYRADQIARADLIAISALDQYQLGMAPTKRMTTTEVQQVSTAGGARVQADAQAYEEFCAGVAHDCLDWLMQFDVKTRELPIYGPDDQVTAWVPVSAQDIQGDYFVEVYMGSTMVKDSATQVKDIGFLLQNLLPFFQMPDPEHPGTPMLYAKPLLQQLLKAVPEIRNIRDILEPPPPPAPAGPPGLPGAPPGPPGMPLPPGGLPAPPGGPAPNPLEALALLRAHAMAGGPPPPNGNGR